MVPGPNRCLYHTTTVVGSKHFVFGKIGGKTINDMWTVQVECAATLLNSSSDDCLPVPMIRDGFLTCYGRVSAQFLREYKPVVVGGGGTSSFSFLTPGYSILPPDS